MGKYKNQNIIEERVEIEGIPCLRFYPSEISGFVQPFPTVFYYHGWSSEKNKQKLMGYVFSTLGYQVILPDAVHHGERNKFEDYDKALNEFFLPTIMQNLAEFSVLKDYAVKHCNADKNRLAVSGHSMGGFTTAGIFTHNPSVKTAVVFNGACDWQNAILQIKKEYDEAHIEFDEATKKADPAQNIGKLLNRPLFLLHGIKDSLVSYKIQKQFYDSTLPLYKNKELLRLMSVERMNHYISIQMLDEAILWLGENL